MRHFYRTQIPQAEVLRLADSFFPAMEMERAGHTAKSRIFSGMLGTLQLNVKTEGGHYTFVEVATDQMGESRLDRNAKRFFVDLHRADDPAHRVEAAY
jgi:hypothetical protein